MYLKKTRAWALTYDAMMGFLSNLFKIQSAQTANMTFDNGILLIVGVSIIVLIRLKLYQTFSLTLSHLLYFTLSLRAFKSFEYLDDLNFLSARSQHGRK